VIRAYDYLQDAKIDNDDITLPVVYKSIETIEYYFWGGKEPKTGDTVSPALTSKKCEVFETARSLIERFIDWRLDQRAAVKKEG
jgi:hypothetical protein